MVTSADSDIFQRMRSDAFRDGASRVLSVKDVITQTVTSPPTRAPCRLAIAAMRPVVLASVGALGSRDPTAPGR